MNSVRTCRFYNAVFANSFFVQIKFQLVMSHAIRSRIEEATLIPSDWLGLVITDKV